MGEIAYELGLSGDRQRIAFEIHDDRTPLAHIIMDAAGVEDLILNLANLRAQMAEGVPPSLDPSFRIRSIHSPAWRVPETVSGEQSGTMLALRHPGLGWLAFLFAGDQARAIAKALIDYTPGPK